MNVLSSTFYVLGCHSVVVRDLCGVVVMDPARYRIESGTGYGMTVIYMSEKFEEPTTELTDADFDIADEIMDSLSTNPKKSLRLYMQASPAVKKMLGGFNPLEMLIQVNPNIEEENIVDYMKACDVNDELSMKRIYKLSSSATRVEIDDLFG